LGLRTLLYYSHTVDSRVATIRCEAFKECALERGATVHELWWEPKTTGPKGVGRIAWLAAQLNQLSHPLGVLAVNDVVASEVIDAAEQAGLRVPEDVAVLGVDNDPILTELGTVPLSSIDVARQRVGYEAAALLDRMLDGAKPPAKPLLVAPAGVITRRSTEIIAVADADIRKAAHFIHAHFREPITVADVVASTFLSRRRAQDRFQAAIGHGMSEEITRQRLQFSKYLLTQTGHKIARIASMSGFGGVQRMSKVFRRELGTTPQAYRQTYQASPRSQP
jgi:LacI family transcriptional regulator